MGMNAWRVSLVALSVLPDVDVIAFALGIPYSAPWGHRGAAHSLAVAALAGLAGAVAVRAWGAGALRMGIVGGLVTASHGLLDTLTDGGLGIGSCGPGRTIGSSRPGGPSQWRPSARPCSRPAEPRSY
jgi:inner membrane protein